MKTRLAAETSAEWAAQVARAFLLDTMDRLAGVDIARVLAFTPPAAQSYFADIARGRFRLAPQADGDLGRRMAAFFAEQFQAGADRAVLVGADSPTLPIPFILQAFRELEKADLVIGPSTDGGYYLVGCVARPAFQAAAVADSAAAMLPPIFDDIPWSTPGVLAHTIAALRKTGWRLALLSPWYDVDTSDDWRMLQGHVAAQRRAGLDPGVPHTEQLLLGQDP